MVTPARSSLIVHPGFRRVAAILALAAAVAVASAWSGDGTAIEEVVMYGIDADTNELLRYSFETDTFVAIGVVRTESDDVIDDTEALTWVASGPAKGMYCIPRDGALSGKLLRINPLDARAEIVSDTGFDGVTGMVAIQNPVTGDWVVIVSDRKAMKLLLIDPQSGAVLAAFDVAEKFEGLALGPHGTLYGNTRRKLYVIDPSSGSETFVGDIPYNKVEALEYGFGDGAPQIDVPGIPSEWTADGALFAFDDDSDSLMIVDPASGDAMDYPCSFSTVDCEGLILTTRSRDPYGPVVANVFD